MDKLGGRWEMGLILFGPRFAREPNSLSFGESSCDSVKLTRRGNRVNTLQNCCRELGVYQINRRRANHWSQVSRIDAVFHSALIYKGDAINGPRGSRRRRFCRTWIDVESFVALISTLIVVSKVTVVAGIRSLGSSTTTNSVF